MAIDQLTFGVELEVLLPRNLTRRDLADAITQAGVETHEEIYNHSARPAWKIVTDGSIAGYGAELVSPILRGDEDYRQLHIACDALVAAGCRINRSCGFHVHVGAPNDIGFMKRLHALYVKYESIIDGVLSASRRADNNSYCRSPAIDNTRIDNATNLYELRTLNRYRKLNVTSFFRHGTVEFRAHQGTTEASKAINWVKFCLRMVDEAMKQPNTTPTAFPEKPIITSRTNMYRQRKFDALARYAETGNWNMVEAFPINGIDTYNQMLRRYKAALLAARPQPTTPAPLVEEVTLAGLLRRLQAPAEEVTYFTRRATYFARRAA